MGDAGALFLGVLLATLIVRFQPNTETQIGSFFTPLFLLSIPILDTTIAILSRIKRHLSPFQGGQDHLSHRLVRSGFSRKQTAFILWGLSAVFAGLSITLSKQFFLNEIMVVAIGITLLLILFIVFFRKKDS